MDFAESKSKSLRALDAIKNLTQRPEPISETPAYHAYLQTEAWLVRRKLALAAAGYRCQLCNGTVGLNVHHRTYDHIYNETLADLTVLCGACHSKFHGKVNQ